MDRTTISLALLAILVLLLLSAGIEDVRRREIANWKNAAIALLAVPFWFAVGLSPWPDMALQLLVAAVTLTVFVGAFAMGWMGGGDVKMIAALALWLPLGLLVQMLVVMSLAGGALTLAMVADRHLRRRSAAGTPVEVPYGVAIAVAALVILPQPILNQFS